MFNLLLVVFLVVCLLLALFILVQSDKGGGISGAVGGGIANANSAIGAQNAENILTRGTTILAVAFFALALLIFWVSSGNSEKAKGSSLGKAATQNVQQGTSAELPVDASGEGFQLPETVEPAPVVEEAPVAPETKKETPAEEGTPAPVE